MNIFGVVNLKTIRRVMDNVNIELSYNPNIVVPKIKSIYLDLDGEYLKDVEVVTIKRGDKTLTFPIWEFWQTLEKYNDCDGCEFW